MRFLSDSGDGGAAAVTVEELVEDCWSDEHGQGEFEGFHCKVEPDLDVINTEAALDRLLENEVVCDIPRDEGAGMKDMTTRWEKTWKKRNEWEVQSSLRGPRMQMAGVVGGPVRTGSFFLDWTNCGHSLAQTSCAYFHSGLHECFSSGLSRTMWWWKSI